MPKTKRSARWADEHEVVVAKLRSCAGRTRALSIVPGLSNASAARNCRHPRRSISSWFLRRSKHRRHRTFLVRAAACGGIQQEGLPTLLIVRATVDPFSFPIEVVGGETERGGEGRDGDRGSRHGGTRTALLDAGLPFSASARRPAGDLDRGHAYRRKGSPLLGLVAWCHGYQCTGRGIPRKSDLSRCMLREVEAVFCSKRPKQAEPAAP